nr:hypothetical protein [uncultured Carboxylicivirga sp.]
MTKQALKKLKSKLPRNYRGILAKRTGKSESAVYQALIGTINSPEIIDEAIRLAEEQVHKNNDMLKKIESL